MVRVHPIQDIFDSHSSLFEIVELLYRINNIIESAAGYQNVFGMEETIGARAPPLLIEKIHELMGKVLATKKGTNIAYSNIAPQYPINHWSSRTRRTFHGYIRPSQSLISCKQTIFL